MATNSRKPCHCRYVAVLVLTAPPPHRWSPRGVLTAALNAAKFRLSGREVAIPGPELLRENFPRLPLLRGLALEGVANRDSIGYLPQYGLPEDLPTILRGTLRYPGFSRIVDAFKRVGLLDTAALAEPLQDSSQLLSACLGVSADKSLEDAVLARLDGDAELCAETMSALREYVHFVRLGRK